MKFTLEVEIDFNEKNGNFTVSSDSPFVQVVDKNLEYAFQELGARLYKKCSSVFNKVGAIDEADYKNRLKQIGEDVAANPAWKL